MGRIGEAELLQAAQNGTAVDGGKTGTWRTVPASLLRRFCLDLKDQVDPRGLQLRRTVVTGALDLAGLVVPFPLVFDRCEFRSALAADGADLFALALTGCPYLPGLLANGLRVRRDLNLSRSAVTGGHRTTASTSRRAAIWLCESEIGGRLLCADTVIRADGERAIQADRMHVGGTVRLIHKFTARGEIRLLGARIDGSLDLTGANLDNDGGPALDLADAVIGGSLFVISDTHGRRPVINGRIDLGSTKILGQILIRNATLCESGTGPVGSGYSRSRASGTAVSAPRLSVGAEVTLEGTSEVIGGLDLSMADMSTLTLGAGCRLHAPGRTALNMTNTEIRSLFRFDENAAVEGTLRLAGAVIHGTLALHGQMREPENRSLVGASALTVDGDVYLDGLRTYGGRVNFRGATLGSLWAETANLQNPSGYTVSLHQAHVKGSVQLGDNVASTGMAVFNRSVIDGRLVLRGSFTCPAPALLNRQGHAIEATSATVRGGTDLGWKLVSPSADFTNATTTFLADVPTAWPERYTIAGMSYDRFESPQSARVPEVWDQKARCNWLAGQATFDAGSYEQAAAVFRRHGYAREADQILIAQRRHARSAARATATRIQRALDAVYAVIGYGYRPWRVLWFLAALLILVTVSLEVPAGQNTLRTTTSSGAIYTTRGLLRAAGSHSYGPSQRAAYSATDSCGNGAVRCFSPALYAIDTVIPLVALDQRSTWYPDPHAPGGQFMLWWLNSATLLGWILSSIFVLSLARLSRDP